MKKFIISTVLLTAMSVSHATDVVKDDLGAAMHAQSQTQAQTTTSTSSTTTMASGFDRELLAEKAPVGTMGYYVRLNENRQENSPAATKAALDAAPSAIGY